MEKAVIDHLGGVFFEGSGIDACQIFLQKSENPIMVIFRKNANTVMIGEERHFYQSTAFPKMLCIKNTLKGIGIEAVERLVGIGADTDTRPEGFAMRGLIKECRYIFSVY